MLPPNSNTLSGARRIWWLIILKNSQELMKSQSKSMISAMWILYSSLKPDCNSPNYPLPLEPIKAANLLIQQVNAGHKLSSSVELMDDQLRRGKPLIPSRQAKTPYITSWIQFLGGPDQWNGHKPNEQMAEIRIPRTLSTCLGITRLNSVHIIGKTGPQSPTMDQHC